MTTAPRQVLLVEDHPGDVALMQEALKRAGLGYHVNVVPDGSAAIEYLHRCGQHADASQPDLIVLDMKLPRKCGLEVFDDISADPGLREIPLVVLSNSMAELDIVKARQGTAPMCRVKPGSFAGYVDLVQAIEAFCQNVKGPPEGGTKP